MIKCSIRRIWVGLHVLIALVGVNGSKEFRSLQDEGVVYEKLGSYQPKTIVTGYAAIDRDINLISAELAKETSVGKIMATRVYQEGAFSGTFAELSLTRELAVSIPRGTAVVGEAVDGSFGVNGKTRRDASAGARTIEVVYDTNRSQVDYLNCIVGAHPEPQLGGCFVESGTLLFPDLELEVFYSYDAREANLNEISLHKMSLDARKNMYDCEACPKNDYKKFVDYYGQYNYADHLITAAMNGAEATFRTGNVDLREHSMEALRELAEDSMIFMTLWMEVIHQMERALDLCEQSSEDDMTMMMKWDTAVAFYTGADLDVDGGADLLYDIANARCALSGTCGVTSGERVGNAHANYQIMDRFSEGQEQLQARQCNDARRTKDQIRRLMTIPLIQGTIRHAHILADRDINPKDSGKGIAYAQSILPILHACSADDAALVYRNMNGATDAAVDFKAVRDAIIRNLECLEISCEEIGGIWNEDTNQWESNTQSCEAQSRSPAKDPTPATTTPSQSGSTPSKSGSFRLVFILLGVLGALAALWLFLRRKVKDSRSGSEKETHYKDSIAPASCPPPEDLDTIVAAADYVPKYWKDCHKESTDDINNHAIDDFVEDAVVGRML